MRTTSTLIATSTLLSLANVDDDKEKAVATRKRLLAMAADKRLLVAGHHMPFPGLGYVERTQGSFRWMPISYQLNL